MILKGVALLAGCFILGQLMGEVLGFWIGIHSNVGGVGFAMLLLILSQNELNKNEKFDSEMENGILFWSKMYIPIIVAMSAVQNVKVAFTNGILAILAGIVPVVVCLFFMPILLKKETN